MNENEHPARADALIAAEDRMRESPCYRERAFTSKLKREAAKDWRKAPRRVDPSVQYLKSREFDTILRGARLTAFESAVVRLILSGHSLQPISSAAGITKQALHQRFSRIREKIRASQTVYRYAGLAEVYESELKRGSNSRAVR